MYLLYDHRLCRSEILMTSLRICRLGNEGGWSLGREFPLKTATSNQTTHTAVKKNQLPYKTATFQVKIITNQHNDIVLVI